MINITNKYSCCGCSACGQVCPRKCIRFNEDEQGFLYPKVDKSLCIDCGLCERVCPVLNQGEHRKPIAVYAAMNPNQAIRLKSSSGGIFTMLAEHVLQEGGIVIGARFDDNCEVVHDIANNIDEVAAFRGSKYLQSRIGDNYKKALAFLKMGRMVLFSGTPCQIAGLRRFLRKDYDKLLTVDVVCHGTPSPKVWRSYLNERVLRPKGVAGKNTVLLSLKALSAQADISFRDKTSGWKKYGFVVRKKSAPKADKNSVLSPVIAKHNESSIINEAMTENLFMQLFLNDLCLRPACYRCPAKDGQCGSDITLADYWGIELLHPEWDDDKGTSLVLVHTEKGMTAFSNIDAKIVATSYEEALASNPAIEHSANEHKWVDRFWKMYHRTGLKGADKLLVRMRKPTIYTRCRTFASRLYHRIFKK